MRQPGNNKSAKSAYSLVELIVVMAIGGLLTAFAIPSIARLGAFSSNELGNTTQELYTMLKAARIYASTHNTDTAVVYTLDNYSTTSNTIREPLGDSMTGEVTRAIVGAALVRKDKVRDLFVPITVREGIFRQFPNEVVIALIPPEQTHGTPLYADLNARYAGLDRLGQLGMKTVYVNFNDENDLTEPLPAHVFTPAGQLDPTDSSKERYTFMVTATPDLAPEERLVIPNTDYDGQTTAADLFISRTIELFRSTGRVKIAS